MTGNDIKNKVERYMDGYTPSDDKILDAIQDAMNWMGNIAGLVNVIDYEAEADVQYDLPQDLIRIMRVEIKDENVFYYNYTIENNVIRFKDANDYKILYTKHPTEYINLNNELFLHPMLENCILTYCKGFIKVTINDTSKDGQRLMQKFEKDAVKAYRTLKRNRKSPTKVKVFRHA